MVDSVQSKQGRTPLYHQFHSPIRVLGQLLQGKSLTRTLFNLALEKHSVKGKILDLGSKSGSGSYYKHLRIGPESEIVHTDIANAEGVVCLDVEKPFPLPDGSFDAVLSFNLFEHVYNPWNAPEEVFRILKKGGVFLVSVPFMHEYHADADDYFRYTDSALVRMWENAGFRCRHMEALGEGLLTACLTKLPTLMWPKFGRRVLTGLMYLLATPIDRALRLSPRRDSKTVAQRFALEHFAVFEKP